MCVFLFINIILFQKLLSFFALLCLRIEYRNSKMKQIVFFRKLISFIFLRIKTNVMKFKKLSLGLIIITISYNHFCARFIILYIKDISKVINKTMNLVYSVFISKRINEFIFGILCKIEVWAIDVLYIQPRGRVVV
jgi:hypothetical protein